MELGAQFVVVDDLDRRAQARDDRGELADGRTPDLDPPAPVRGVEALVGHLLMGVERVVALGSGGNPMHLPDTTGTPADGWVAALDEAVGRAQAAWAGDEVLDRPMWLPWAEGPGRQLLDGYVAELTVHTWDLARALGVDAAWDDEVVDVAWRSYLSMFPEAARQDRFAEVRAAMPPEFQSGPPPFGDGITLDDGAPLVDRVAAWTGRAV